MVIVNDKENILVVFDGATIRSININTDGKRIMANSANNAPPICIGTYETNVKAERAFSSLVGAIEQEKEVYFMPKDIDIKVNRQRGTGRILYNKTNGKTR